VNCETTICSEIVHIINKFMFFMHVNVLAVGILTPTDEFQYWADLAVTAKGEDRERARYFSDTFQKQIAPQFAVLSTLSMADVTELMEETQDILDDLWKQTDFDKPFPDARMKRLLEVIGTDEHLSFSDQISALSKSCYHHICALRCIRPYLDLHTAKTVVTSIVHFKLDYCNSLYYGLPKFQINCLQPIQNAIFLPITWLNLRRSALKVTK